MDPVSRGNRRRALSPAQKERARKALAQLAKLRAGGHQPSCPCQSRGRRGCVELRRACLDGGLWREVAELAREV